MRFARIALAWAMTACIVPTFVSAQSQPRELPPAIQLELDRRGISEEDLRERLEDLGLDLDSLTEEQLLMLRPEIEEIVRELEAESRARVTNQRSVRDTLRPALDPDFRLDSLGADDAARDRGRSRVGNVNRRGGSEPAAPARGTTPAAGGRDRAFTVDSARTARTPVDTSAIQSDEIYGHRLFLDGSIGVFRLSDGVDVPEDYRLAPGDELAIGIFGASQVDLLLRIDDQGFISPPRVPKIYVADLTLGRARQAISDRLRRSYSFTEGQFALSVRGSRTVGVNVFGEVNRSGTYALPTINGVVNAIVAAGGPTTEGSVRRIQRTRGGRTSTFDLYAYLSDAGSTDDVNALRSGDIVFVPLARKVVRVRGAVRRPMRYELLAGEGLAELLEFAGGVSAKAADGSVHIKRYVDGRQVTVDVPAGPSATPLRDGDIVEVRRAERPVEDNVFVRGAVELGGEYAFSPERSVGEIVRAARLRRNARTDVAFIRRTNSDSTTTLIEVNLDEAIRGGAADVRFQVNDTLEVLAQNAFADRAFISVTGAVRRPRARVPYSRDSSLTVSGALLLAGGLSPNAASEGILFRREASNRKVTRYQMVDLGADASFVRLNPYDSLIVFPQELFTDSFQVEIKGAVRRPGRYTYDPSLGIKQLFTLAGGFRQEAALNRIEVFRLEFGEDRSTQTRLGTVEMTADFEVVGGDMDLSILRPYDVIAVRSAPEYEITKQVSVDGEITFPGDYPLNEDIRTVYDLISAAGGITREGFAAGATLYRPERNTGYVILELEEIVADPRSPNNIVLLEGDELFIPKAKELVTIRTVGTRARQNYADSLLAGGLVVIAYQGDRSAKWYIEEFAGGFDKRAAKRTVTVRDPSGRFRRTRSVLGFRDYPTVTPGSSIALDLQPIEVPKSSGERVDWAGVAGAVTTALTAGLSIVLIIQNLRPVDD